MDQKPAIKDFLTQKTSELVALPDLSGPIAARALFWRARYLHEASILPHLPFLFWLMANTRPRNYVELGMTEAVSYFAACQAIDKIGANGRCTGVWSQLPEAQIPAEISSRNEELYAEFSRILNEPTANAAARIADGSVDLLVVNLQRESDLAEAFSRDWLSKLSDCAVVVINGTDNAAFRQSAAAPLLRELCARYPHIHFDEGDGLSVLLVGQNCGESLLGFAGLKPTESRYRNAKSVFHRLGAAHLFEWRARRDKKRLGEAQWRLDRSQKELATLQTEVETRDSYALERAAQAASLQAELYDLRAATVTQAASVAQHIKELTAAEDNARGQISALQQACDQSRAEQLQAQEAHRHELAALTAEIEAERMAHAAEAEELKAALASRDAQCAELQQEFGQFREEQLAAQHARFHEIAALTATIDTERTAHASATEELKAALASRDAQCAELQQEFGQFREEQLAAQHARFHEIAALTATIETERTAHGSAAEELKAALASRDAKAAELQQKFDQSRAKQMQAQDTHRLEVAALAAKVEAERMAQAKAAENLQTTIASRDAKAAELQQKFDQFREEQLAAQHARFHEIAALTATIETERAANAKAAQELRAVLAARDAEFAQRVNALEQQLSEAEAEVVIHRDKYDAITRSTSWRMTGPARKTVDQVRKLRG